MRLFVLVACVPSAASVLNGNYVAASEMDTHPFRGAVQSGGGSGMVITVEGGEAVVFTAAHGYDLKYTEPHSASWMELMDFKKDEDGGLRTAFGSVTATGRQRASTTGLSSPRWDTATHRTVPMRPGMV